MEPLTGLVGLLATSGGMNLGYIIPFLLVISPVVFVHEFGHFIVARWCGVKVETFSIGFGRALVSWRDKYQTQWKIGWLPLGGYVKFAGDEGPASTPDREALERLAPGGKVIDPEAVKGYFHFKPLRARAAIVAAGPIANFIFAILIFAATYLVVGEEELVPRVDVKANSAAAAAGFQSGDRVRAIGSDAIESLSEFDRLVALSAGKSLDVHVARGDSDVLLRVIPQEQELSDRFGNRSKLGQIAGLSAYLPARVDKVAPNSAAATAGIKEGDLIRAIDSLPIQSFGQMQEIIGASAGKPLAIAIERQGQRLVLRAVPHPREITDSTGAKKTVGQLGLTGRINPQDITYRKFDPLSALWKGIDQTYFVIKVTLDFVGGVFIGHQDGSQLSGPLGMAKIAGDFAQIGAGALVNLAAMLSISIGLINLFPIPLLDGGHLLYYAYEAARGRPLGARAQELGFRIGLAFVISMMVFATWNDLVKLQFFGG